MKKFKGFLAGFIVLIVSWKIVEVLVSVGLALGLGAIGTNISENARALADVNAVATLLGVFIGAYLATKIYKSIVNKS